MLKVLFRHGPDEETYGDFLLPLIDCKADRRRPLYFLRLLRDYFPDSMIFDNIGSLILQRLVHPAIYSHFIRRGIIGTESELITFAL